jgi:methylmalonyl-CoA mutase
LLKFKLITVSGHHFSNAGASVVQELAFVLSAGCEYLSVLEELGVKPDIAAPRMQFVFGTGSNYFMEIAKLRAARTLWSKVVESFGGSEASCKMYIHSVVTEWNKTIYDSYVNMLRSTTEAMSATLGGTDSLEVTPFDSPYAQASDFSSRIARNTQIILKEEAHFDKVVDPAAGSYYIENLTDQIAEHAWALFIEIEGKGGFSEAFQSGFIQEKIKQTASQRLKAIATRKEVLLGTNQYPNTNEHAADKTDIEKFSLAFDDGGFKRIAEPVKPFRGAMEFEILRLSVEKAEKIPVAFMLTIGSPAMRKARSNFSGNFFSCAGYKIIDNNGFVTPEAGVKAAFECGANIIVLCSGDDEYATFAPQVHELVDNKAILVIAGEPACKTELEAKGIKNYISLRSNVLDTLKYYNNLLGI